MPALCVHAWELPDSPLNGDFSPSADVIFRLTEVGRDLKVPQDHLQQGAQAHVLVAFEGGDPTTLLGSLRGHPHSENVLP